MIPHDTLNEDAENPPSPAASGGPVEIEVLLSNVVFGPFTEAKIRERLEENLLSLTDHARMANTEDWYSLQDVLEQLPPAPEPVAEELAVDEPAPATADGAAESGNGQTSVPELPPSSPAPIRFTPPQAPAPAVAPATPSQRMPRPGAGTGPLPAPVRRTSSLPQPGSASGRMPLLKPQSARPGTKALGGLRSQILARTSSEPLKLSQTGLPKLTPRAMTAPLPSFSKPASLSRPAPLPEAKPAASPAPPEPEPAASSVSFPEPMAPAPSPAPISSPKAYRKPDDTPVEKPVPVPFSENRAAPSLSSGPTLRFTPIPIESLPALRAARAAAEAASKQGEPPAPNLSSPKASEGAPVSFSKAPVRFRISRPKLDEDEDVSPQPPAAPVASAEEPAALVPEPTAPPAVADVPPQTQSSQSPVRIQPDPAPALVDPLEVPASGFARLPRAAEEPPKMSAATPVEKENPPLPPAKPAETRPTSTADSILTVRLPARRTQVIKTLPGASVKGPESKTSDSQPVPPLPPAANPPAPVPPAVPKRSGFAEISPVAAPVTASPPPSVVANPPRAASNPVRRGGMTSASAMAATKLINPEEKKELSSTLPGMESSPPTVVLPRPATVDFSPPSIIAPEEASAPPAPSAPLMETRRVALRQARNQRKRLGIALAVVGFILFLLLCAGIYHFATATHDPSDKPTGPAPAAPAPSTLPVQPKTGVVAAPEAKAVAAQPNATVPAPKPAAAAPEPKTQPAPPPVNPEATAWFSKGQTAQAKGDFNRAIQDFSQALQIDPKYAQAYGLRAAASQAKGDLAGAIADTNQLVTLDPNNANGFSQRGFLKQANKDLDGALADYTHALQLDPKSYIAAYNRGMIQAQKGRPDDAIADYNRALEINPRLAGAFYNRGNAKMDKADLEGAIADFSNALEINPKIALASCNRALAQQNLGNLDLALADYNQAIALDPNIGMAYYNRGLIKEQRNDLDGCIEDSTKALELNPSDAQAYYNRGVALQAKGNLDAAANDLRKFAELSPKNPYADYAHLYLWIITNKQSHKTQADQDLSASLDSNWNAEPAQLPSKIAAFLLDRVAEADLLAAATSPEARRNQSQHCEVWYFDGVKKMLDGNKKSAIDCFHQCLSTAQKDYCEYLLAQAELQNLSPS